MKVLNLRCAHDHRFEGWFASDDDFGSQMNRGLIACPLCDDTGIERLPSAPRLNMVTRRGDVVEPAAAAAVANTADSKPALANDEASVQAKWLQAARALLSKTEDVGDRFPEEARRIHYGEAAERGIRGRATREDAEALHDEGIEVFGMALPEALKGPLQ